jgi:hypothetical protein
MALVTERAQVAQLVAAAAAARLDVVDLGRSSTALDAAVAVA